MDDSEPSLERSSRSVMKSQVTEPANGAGASNGAASNAQNARFDETGANRSRGSGASHSVSYDYFDQTKCEFHINHVISGEECAEHSQAKGN